MYLSRHEVHFSVGVHPDSPLAPTINEINLVHTFMHSFNSFIKKHSSLILQFAPEYRGRGGKKRKRSKAIP
jgi:hypothetical protein